MMAQHPENTWFANQVLTWYDQNGRKNLPWKRYNTPYHIWLSEIMLQQTQVSTVIPYFEKFVQQFTNIQALANAPLDDVLTLWAGLGYYARARNLHKAAKILTEKYNGKLPKTKSELNALPGIGESTAGAILAQSYNIRAAILDGNVKRVLSRFYAVNTPQGKSETLKKLWQLSEKVTPYQRIKDYTQGIMDIGALVCKRTQANCPKCPLNTACQAYRMKKTHLYPVPKSKNNKPIKQTRFLLAFNDSKEILLEKRPLKGIWGGLWSFPEFGQDAPLNKALQEQYGFKIIRVIVKNTRRHTFTHYHLDYKPILARVKINSEYKSSKKLSETEQKWCKISDAIKLGIPTPHKNLLNNLIRDNS